MVINGYAPCLGVIDNMRIRSVQFLIECDEEYENE
jgi:hypothetical protein